MVFQKQWLSFTKYNFYAIFFRFTEDIFSSLINAIFIIEALTKLHAVYIIHSIMSDYCMDNLSTAALFSGITPSSATVENSTNGLMMMDDPGSIVSSLILNSTSMEPILQEVRADMDGDDVTQQPNTALFCTVLTLGTFIIAYFLRIFRNSKFLGRSVRIIAFLNIVIHGRCIAQII